MGGEEQAEEVGRGGEDPTAAAKDADISNIINNDLENEGKQTLIPLSLICFLSQGDSAEASRLSVTV